MATATTELATETDRLKQQLVDCIRMLEHSDIIDYNGHVSTRAGDGPIAALSVEEGELADVINQSAGVRAWNLWRTQVRATLGW